MYNYKINYHATSGTYRLFENVGGYWLRVIHPLGKTLRSRQHAVNFMNWYKRKRCSSSFSCNRTEYLK